MFKEWRKYILIMIFVMGGIFESFKRIGMDTPQHTNDVQVAELTQMDLRPFRVNPTDSVKRPGSKVLIGDRKPRSKKISISDLTFAKNHSFDETPKKKTKKDKEDKKKLEVKKKDGKETKQEKVTKTTPKTDKDEFEPYDTDEDEGFDNNGIADNEPIDGGVGTVTPDNVDEEENDVPQTFEEWAQIILRSPSFKAVTEFIGHQQKGDFPISVYYEVVDAMLLDSRFEMQELAIYALGSTPGLRSFITLTDVLDSNAFLKEIKIQARGQLDKYTSMRYVSTLKRVLVNEDSLSASLLAANLLNQSAKKNLSIGVTETEGGDDVSGQDTETPGEEVQGEVSDVKDREPANGEVDSRIYAEYLDLSEFLKELTKDDGLEPTFNDAIAEVISTIDELTAGAA